MAGESSRDQCSKEGCSGCRHCGGSYSSYTSFEKEVKVSKIDLSKIVSNVQKLYNKDKKAIDIISTGASVKVDYSENDVIVLPESNPVR